ncbi:WD repeat-containing protein 75 [Quillaja saponaria]|uniref:WD repeat-containing protein 75 n=1 Tax=Quillaja saponaria TaxID=32244 RepID=A0AAD7LDH5_QUISA|nr:WD repeat-containing protein 75 [Quillaja saponaria]
MVGGIILKETARPEFLTISSSGEFFGIRNKRKLLIWKAPAKDYDSVMAKKITLHHTKDLTVIEFHPTERIVAAGDLTGRILLWRGFGSQKFVIGGDPMNERSMNNEEEKPGVRGNDYAESCSMWHWHPVEVRVLFFSSDVAYLYSGGKEGVLVVWQLDTGKKKFLPRIGISTFIFTDSTDPSLSSISCADNQIHLLKMPSMEIFKSISGIKLSFILLRHLQRYVKVFVADLPLIVVQVYLLYIQRITASNFTACLMIVELMR